jgi:putative endonuclease
MAGPRHAPRSARAKASGRIGRSAEWLALLALMAKGYRPLARRYGGKGGEIDLIAKRGRTIIFVEVKARAALDDALDSIGAEKTRLIARRARDWRTRNPWAAGFTFRGDAVYCGAGLWPRHVPDAFALDGP